MNSPLNIRYLANEEINRKKWDACINSSSGPIYGHSWYLDQMAKRWDALVLNDYEAVMPITWNRKFGMSYMYQPFLTPQLGVFAEKTSKQLLQTFLRQSAERFKYIEINLNTANPPEIDDYKLTSNTCYSLALDRSYEKLVMGFRTNLVRNIKKARTAGCEYRTEIPIDRVLKLAGQQLKQYTRLQKDDLSRFRKLCEYLLSKNKAQAVGVFLGNQLLSSSIFFFNNNRAYYILAGNDVAGKPIGASHFLLSEFIRENAGKNLVLDFVGSNFRSIAFFYESFGAEAEHYPSIKINRLPYPVKWLKK